MASSTFTDSPLTYLYSCSRSLQLVRTEREHNKQHKKSTQHQYTNIYQLMLFQSSMFLSNIRFITPTLPVLSSYFHVCGTFCTKEAIRFSRYRNISSFWYGPSRTEETGEGDGTRDESILLCIGIETGFRTGIIEESLITVSLCLGSFAWKAECFIGRMIFWFECSWSLEVYINLKKKMENT